MIQDLTKTSESPKKLPKGKDRGDFHGFSLYKNGKAS